ncbi:ABC transporter ATP-binding protein [Thioalkalivibrio sp. HK1]|uniref:ABC transporter ATP-binding protein n=1 Tax=Thioalkalivibrio sp. HK1 TaxID=1469245 RepID=UPI0004724D27|nr:ABC transporter ATP-binding protein [Thioalkalivibrio sp. HK1]
MNPAGISLQSVDAGYDHGHVLQGLSFSVEPGEMVALLGRNGSGKTTALKTIMGILRAQSGRIEFSDIDITDKATYKIAGLGIAYVPETRGIFASLSVHEHLTLVGAKSGWSLDRIYDTFPRLAERRSHRGSKLSGGEQQMLAIARALRMGPRLLILDEPTEGLAPVIVEEIATIIEGLKHEGMTMVIVEQNYAFAARIADRIHIIGRGRLRWSGTPAEFDADDEVRFTWLGI